jgi:hypothetical protein
VPRLTVSLNGGQKLERKKGGESEMKSTWSHLVVATLVVLAFAVLTAGVVLAEEVSRQGAPVVGWSADLACSEIFAEPVLDQSQPVQNPDDQRH